MPNFLAILGGYSEQAVKMDETKRAADVAEKAAIADDARAINRSKALFDYQSAYDEKKTLREKEKELAKYLTQLSTVMSEEQLKELQNNPDAINIIPSLAKEVQKLTIDGISPAAIKALLRHNGEPLFEKLLTQGATPEDAATSAEWGIPLDSMPKLNIGSVGMAAVKNPLDFRELQSWRELLQETGTSQVSRDMNEVTRLTGTLASMPETQKAFITAEAARLAELSTLMTTNPSLAAIYAAQDPNLAARKLEFPEVFKSAIVGQEFTKAAVLAEKLTEVRDDPRIREKRYFKVQVEALTNAFGWNSLPLDIKLAYTTHYPMPTGQ
jgi:hypothetical protein